jgi:hypothetical protein
VPQHKEIPQNIDRIDHKAAKVLVCRGYMRAVLSDITARTSVLVDRNHKYRPRYRPRINPRFCRSFVLYEPVAGNAVDILRDFSKAKSRHKSHLLGKIALRVLIHPT